MYSGIITGALALIVLPFVSAQGSCDPITGGIGICAPNLGLTTSTYSIDFTKQTSTPKEWIVSNYATVNYGSNGAEFAFAKRYDSPQIWTNFYILFGKVETVLQVAPGQGMISSSVLISDDLDEIDWEFSGNNFGMSSGKGQNNFYGKGITGSYDRGQFFDVQDAQSTFHTYTVDWTPDHIIWSVDGNVVRSLLATECDNNMHQFPQSPSRLQLGIWDGGDADTGPGTVSWAGGYTDLSKAPFTMYVKSVKITNANPAYAYNYTDTSGNWKSIQILQKPVSSTSTSTTSVTPLASLASTAVSSVISALSSSLASLGSHFAGSSATPFVTASFASTSATATSAASSSTTTKSSSSTTSVLSSSVSSTFLQLSLLPISSSVVLLTSQVVVSAPSSTSQWTTSSTSTTAHTSTASTSTASQMFTSSMSTTSQSSTSPTSTVSSSTTSTAPKLQSSTTSTLTPSISATVATTDRSTSVSSFTSTSESTSFSSAVSVIPSVSINSTSSLNSSQLWLVPYTTKSMASQFSETVTLRPKTGLPFFQNTSLASNYSIAETSVLSSSSSSLTATSTIQPPATTTKATLGSATPSPSLPATPTPTQSSASHLTPIPWQLWLWWSNKFLYKFHW